MQNLDHPEQDLLLRYIKQADSAEFDDLRLHLAGCDECRDQVTAMTALIQHYPWLETDAYDKQQDQDIIDLVENKLSDNEATSVLQSVKNDPAALKAALHYSSHSVAMKQNVAQQTPATSNVSMTDSILEYFKQWLSFRVPLWQSIPATAVAIMAIVVISQNTLLFDQGEYTIASYQDNPVIQYRGKQALPGIGFFNKADRGVATYNNVKVSLLKEDTIQITWPKVKNATTYTMRLQVFNQGEKQTINEVTTNENMASFKIDESLKDNRYEWILSGQTTNDKTFYTDGGFVISQK